MEDSLHITFPGGRTIKTRKCRRTQYSIIDQNTFRKQVLPSAHMARLSSNIVKLKLPATAANKVIYPCHCYQHMFPYLCNKCHIFTPSQYVTIPCTVSNSQVHLKFLILDLKPWNHTVCILGMDNIVHISNDVETTSN